MPDSRTAPLETLGYLLIVVSSLLSMDQISNLDWHADHGGDSLRLGIDLVGGGGVNIVVSLLPESGGLTWAMQTAFDQLQQDLPETAQFWGQPMPACRTGHAHGSWCRIEGEVVELYCPADQNTLRILAILPGS